MMATPLLNSDKMKECPKCKEYNALFVGETRHHTWIAWCNDCDVMVSKVKSREEAIAKWNAIKRL